MEEHLRQSISNHPSAFQLHNSSPHRSERMARTQHEATSTALELQEIMHHRSGSPDEEGIPPPRYTADSDPFKLASKLKTDEEIRQIKANTSRKRDNAHSVKVVEKGKQALTTRKLQGFYEKSEREY